MKFMPKELTYKFIASPASLNYAALDGTRNTFVVTSEKVKLLTELYCREQQSLSLIV